MLFIYYLDRILKNLRNCAFQEHIEIRYLIQIHVYFMLKREPTRSVQNYAQKWLKLCLILKINDWIFCQEM